ncbi:MAG: efflux RND transporter periplasmic adaptor subunit [Casimicrobiaceae bacterium]
MATNADLSKLRIDRSLASVRRPRRGRWIALAVVALLVLAVAIFMATRPKVYDVQTSAVTTTYPSQQFVTLNATGYVVAQRKAAIASKATGRLEWLGVAEGSRVKAGEVIARLDNRDVVAQAQVAEANVNAARAVVDQALAEENNAREELKRNEDLVTRNFISKSALDTARARLERAIAATANSRAQVASAQASARNAQVSVDYTLIRAPFDGVIVSKSANVGDMVTPFSSAVDSKGAVVNMADMSTLEVEADVSESSLSKISVGEPAEIALDALPDVRFRGHIHRIVPTIDRAKATVMTKVAFESIDPRILPEMSAKVAFLSQEVSAEQQKPLIAVATGAITQRDGRATVFVVDNDHATAVTVTTGAKIGDVTAVSGALKPGQRVVLKPAAELVTGARVKVAAR